MEKVDIGVYKPTEKNEAQQIETVHLSTMDNTHDALAEPKEQEGATEPSVRLSTRSNNGVPLRRLPYLAKAEAILQPSMWEDIARMPAKEAEEWRKAAEEEIAEESEIKNQT